MCKTLPEATPTLAELSVLPALDHLMSTYNRLHLNRLRNTPEGHWINEAFVVRLWAVLESHRVVTGSKRIRQDLDGWRAVDICRRLRHQIGHANGDIHDQDAELLAVRIGEVFGVQPHKSIFLGKFVLSKDTVLRPMFNEARKYCSSLLESETAGTSDVSSKTQQDPRRNDRSHA
jgi:hypothetical protein